MSENSNSKYSYPNYTSISESMNALQKAHANSSHDPSHDRVNDMCDKLCLLNFTRFVKDIITLLEYLLKSAGFSNPKLKSFSSKEFTPIDEKEAYLSYEFISEKYTNISNSEVDISFDFHRPNKDSYFIATAQSRCYPQEYKISNSLIQKTNSYELKDKVNINCFLSECVALLKIPACPNFKKYFNLCNYLQDKIFFPETMLKGNSQYFVYLLIDYMQVHILNFKSNVKNPDHTKLHSNKKNFEKTQKRLQEEYDDLLNSYIEEFRYRPADDPTADPEPFVYVNLMFIQGILKDNGLFFDNIPDFLNNFKEQERFSLSVFKRFDYLQIQYLENINESMNAKRKHAMKHADEPLSDVIGKNIVAQQVFINLFTKYCPEIFNQETQDLNNPANCIMLLEGFLSKTISKNLIKSLKLQIIETKTYTNKLTDIHDLDILYKKTDDIEYLIYLYNIADRDKKFNEQYSAALKWLCSYSGIELEYQKQRISAIKIFATFTLNKDHDVYNGSAFEFTVQSLENPSEVISILKWILSVRKRLLGNEFKALLSTIEKINAYYIKFQKEHDSHPTYGTEKLPTYISQMFVYFEDKLFSDLGSCNLKKENRTKDYIYNQNRLKGFTQKQTSEQYDNLVKLYNAELKKLKSGNMFNESVNESMNAKRKMQKPVESKNIGTTIADKLFFSNLLLKYCPELENKENKSFNNFENCFMLFQAFLKKSISEKIAIDFNNCEIDFCNTNAEYDAKDVNTWSGPLQDIQEFINKMINDDAQYELISYITNDEKLKNAYLPAWTLNNITIIFGFINKKINYINIGFNYKNGFWATVYPIFGFHVNSIDKFSEIIAIFKWLLNIHQKVLSDNFKAFLNTALFVNDYEKAKAYGKDLPLSIDSEVFHYFQNTIFSNGGANLDLKSTKNDIYLFRQITEYHNLIELYNKELEKLKSGTVSESMNARQKHVMKHADDPLPDVMGNNIVVNQVFINLFQKYCPELLNQETQDLNNPSNCVMLVQTFLHNIIRYGIHFGEIRILNKKNFESRPCSVQEMNDMYEKAADVPEHYKIYYGIDDEKIENQYTSISLTWNITISFEYYQQKISSAEIYINLKLNNEYEKNISLKFNFPIQSLENPSEVISMLKWILTVRKKLMSDEFKALVEASIKIDEYYAKFHKSGTVYDKVKLPLYSSHIFNFFEDELFPDLGSCNLYGKYQKYKDDLSKHSGIFYYAPNRKQYKNLVELYNKELEKLKSGVINESMNAKQKHAIKHSDDLPLEKITSSIAENALNTKICQKYNDGKIYDFKSFDLRTLGKEDKTDKETEFTNNFVNVLKNFMSRNFISISIDTRAITIPFKYGAYSETIGNYRFLKWDMFGWDINTWFIKEQIFQFLYSESSSEITFSIKLNYNADNLKDDFHRINGMSATSVLFEIGRLKSNEKHIDAFKLCDILKKIKSVYDFEKFLMSDNFKVFYNILKNIVNIQLYITNSLKSTKINITSKDYNIRNIMIGKDNNGKTTNYFYDDNLKYKFEYSACKSVKDILSNNSKNKSPMVFSPGGNRNIIQHLFNICTADPAYSFIELRDFLKWEKEGDPYINFILDVFRENQVTMKDGNIPMRMKDFTGLDFSSLLDKPFLCSKSLIKLCASGNVKKQYRNFTNFVEYYEDVKN